MSARKDDPGLKTTWKREETTKVGENWKGHDVWCSWHARSCLYRAGLGSD